MLMDDTSRTDKQTSYALSRKARQQWRVIFLWLVIGFCVGIIVWLISLGQYIRPFQDDFYYYPPQSSQEMSDLLQERYHWTGRLSTTTFHLAIGWSQLHWIVPLVSFALMIGGIFAFSRVIIGRFFAVSPRSIWKLALLWACALTTVIFLVTPSPYSSIFWLSGAPIHFWSYGLVLLYSAYLLTRLFAKDQSLKWYDYPTFIVVPAIIGMFGEIAMFTLLAFAVVILVAGYLYKSRKFLRMALANFVGLGVAFYALFFSLGAIIRRGAEKTAPLSEVVSHAPYVIAKNIYALLKFLMNNRILLVVVILVAMALGIFYMKHIQNRRRMFMYLIGFSVVLFGLLCLNFVAVYSSVRFDIAWSRTQAFSVIVLIGILVAYGLVAGGLLKERLRPKVAKRIAYTALSLAAVCVIANAGFIPYVQDFATSIQSRATAYDEREAYIKTLKSDTNIVCPIELKSTYLWGTQETFDLVDDPSHALNQGVKRYYRLPCDVSGT